MLHRLRRQWQKAHRFSFTTRKISRPIIHDHLASLGSDERTLVIHPEAGLELFPNKVIVSRRADDAPDILVDEHFHELSRIESGAFPIVLCIGLLEHLVDPAGFLREVHRILAPGGRLILKCSCAFSIHDGPRDYFHFTQYGVRVLLRDWSRIELAKGTCGPFTTLAILLQRIHLQCDIFPPLRPLMEIAFHALPFFDRFVRRQYHHIHRIEENCIDSMLPSNVMVVAVK